MREEPQLQPQPELQPKRRSRSPWLLLGLLVLALAGGYGYLRSGVPEPPRLEVTPAVIDFGEIPPTEKAVVEYTVKNTGGSPLEILRVSTSCGCTTAEVEKTTLLPGETTALHVTFDPQAMYTEGLSEEEILRIIYLKSNDPERPEAEVELRGRVAFTADSGSGSEANASNGNGNGNEEEGP